MKLIAHLFTGIVLTALVAFASAPAYSQAEIDPDHFELPGAGNAEPAKTARAAPTHYSGKFTLPYAVQCNGKKLSPGRYSVSLSTEGKTGKATLNQRGQVTKLVGTVHKNTKKAGADALLVDHSGKKAILSALRLSELDVVFDPQLQDSSANMSARMETLPLKGSKR